MPFENPGAYDEARKRIREKSEKEQIIIENTIENFEKSKERITKKKSLDVFELKRRIETGKSLDSLKTEIEDALKEGNISFETYTKTLRDLRKKTSQSDEDMGNITLAIPFSDNAFAKYLEEKKWGENPVVDMVGIMYGFFIQGSALMVILIWNILVDILRLPYDLISISRD